MDLDIKQQEAVQSCLDLSKRIVAVTGKAGTGKTSIMRHVFTTLGNNGYSVAACAPTGKAAKRIKEATGIAAETIHRLLEFPRPGERDPKTGRALDVTLPKRCRALPLEHDVVLVDEYAMVNHDLHRQLLDALKPGASIRMFGDVNQLPPIEKSKALNAQPSPFEDVLKRFTGITLETIHRQGEGSGIVTNGARILSGFPPRRTDDFQLHVTDRPHDALMELLAQAQDKQIDYTILDNQIIVTMNKSWVGTYKINAILQQTFRTEMDGWYDLPRHPWDAELPVRIHVGDKVVCTQNNYAIGSNTDTLGMFNGEVGIVQEIGEFGEVLIDLGDRVVNVPPILVVEWGEKQYTSYPQKDITLAYALTTHKCQGSEYKNVIYIINKSAYYMLNRKNFYTAITRAREAVSVITDQKALAQSLAVIKPRV